ncbi:MAG: alpha/beta hydrolase-fold protein [Ignavibacteriales bacterium]|nr:alpha/beta hydrolase-fold protein [Ignavibacteriales bacterium]
MTLPFPRFLVALAIVLPAFLSTGRSQTSRVTISVIAPAPLKKNDIITIAGNCDALASWDASCITMNRVNDSLWSLTFAVPTGFDLEFKITRGSWKTEAIYQKGQIPPNTGIHVLGDTGLTLRPISWLDGTLLSTGGITGTVRYHRAMEGEGLTAPRDVIVWLPPSYSRKLQKRYPVLYMHDGQNIFDPATSFTQIDWRVDEIADSLIKAGAIDEPIIVGIYNNGPRRRPEYSDTKEGHAYVNFVIRRLKPMIDSTYRTMPDADHTAVMGSSMGGLISFLFAWWHPEKFSMAGCLSSAFLIDSNKTLKEIRLYAGPKKKMRVYLDDGGVGLDAQLKPGFEEMTSLLESKGYQPGVDLQSEFYPAAEHNERAWSQRVWRSLTFFFGKHRNQPQLSTATLEDGGIVRLDRTQKRIYLVFTGHEFADGGDVILKTLKKHGVQGSFFFTGDFYRQRKFGWLIERLHKDGHYLGGHSDKHLLYADWAKRDSLLVTKEECVQDLKDNYAAMKPFGVTMKSSPFFLPPYEWYNREVVDWCEELGLTLVNFTGGTYSNADYTTPDMGSRYLSSDTLYRRILAFEKNHGDGLNGFLLLIHFGTHPLRIDKLYNRLDELMTELERRGYTFHSLKEYSGGME